MQRDVGWGATMAVVLAAVVGVSTQLNPRPAANSQETLKVPEQATTPKSSAKDEFAQGPCPELEERLKVFLNVIDRDSIVAPESCGKTQPSKGDKATDKDRKDKVRELAGSLKFVIALVDDPIHTRFALGFDRAAESIQQAATDAGYVYDSSWLPWKTDETEYPLLDDQSKADAAKRIREEQPGVLLFRKDLPHDGEKAAEYPYTNGLVIFVVGEDPTDGVHRAQFRNAAAWIAAFRHAGEPKAPHYELPSSILGPSFSGSLPSLAALLNDIALGGQKTDLSIFSGSVTSNGSVSWFIRATEGRFKNLHFASFQLSDYDALDRYCRYLSASGFDPKRLAIVSEDETAFGTDYNAPGSLPPSCGEPPDNAVSLYYPRDISAVRGAYQKQSMFNGSAPTTDTGKRTLAADIADPAGLQHDTIRSFSGDQTALSQEAVLQQIVSYLRAHHSEYILLRSSNPLDQLFLSHYLRVAYAQGRVVILGADLLLRRETGAARLSGIITLTNYPLFPWNAHWTKVPGGTSIVHSHRPFAQNDAEGAYVAARFLLNSTTVPPALVCIQVGCKFKLPTTIGLLRASGYLVAENTINKSGYRWTDLTISSPHSDRKGSVRLGINDSQVIAKSLEGPETPKPVNGSPLDLFAQFLPVDQNLPIADYNIPFWTRTSVDCAADPSNPCRAAPPPLWLSVLGVNDFWPIAALDDRTIPPDGGSNHARGFRALWDWIAECRTDIPTEISEGGNALRFWQAREAYSINSKDQGAWIPWPPMPSSIRLAIVVLIVWIVFHCACCCFPSVMKRPSHRAYFVSYCHQINEPYNEPDNERALGILLAIGSLSLSSMVTVIAWGYGAFSPDGQPFERAQFGLVFVLLVWLVLGLAVTFNLRMQHSRQKNPSAPARENTPASAPRGE
jgi:hypothetical protein